MIFQVPLEHADAEPGPSGRRSAGTQFDTAHLPTSLSGRVKEMPLGATHFQELCLRFRRSDLIENHLVQHPLALGADFVAGDIPGPATPLEILPGRIEPKKLV